MDLAWKVKIVKPGGSPDNPDDVVKIISGAGDNVSAYWDGKDSVGNPVAGGIYQYFVEAYTEYPDSEIRGREGDDELLVFVPVGDIKVVAICFDDSPSYDNEHLIYDRAGGRECQIFCVNSLYHIRHRWLVTLSPK